MDNFGLEQGNHRFGEGAIVWVADAPDSPQWTPQIGSTRMLPDVALPTYARAMSNNRAQHLVTVWNPRYAADAMEAHLRLLLEWDATATRSGTNGDEVYVWWGKVRSSQRQQQMPHLNEIIALGGASPDFDGSHETHLYITDYQSLYVADVSAIVTDDPRTMDAPHVPAYYTSQGLSCDCWFEIGDIRLLVKDDMAGVIEELARLRNTRYADRPVSLYGGMVDLPLLVSRPDGRRYFDERDRDLFADGKLWARHDAEQGGVGALEATLRDDHFGADAWSALEPGVRRFVAMAERTLRDHRRDPAADLSPVVVGYGKALELQTNSIIRDAMHGATDAARRVKLESGTVLLPDALPLTLGQLARALGGEPELGMHLRRVLTEGAWSTGEFPVILDAFAKEARNLAAHGETVPRATILRWRDRLLGVGVEGVLCRLAKVRKRL